MPKSFKKETNKLINEKKSEFSTKADSHYQESYVPLPPPPIPVSETRISTRYDLKTNRTSNKLSHNRNNNKNLRKTASSIIEKARMFESLTNGTNKTNVVASKTLEKNNAQETVYIESNESDFNIRHNNVLY